jgi:hypothetical protein
VAGYYSTTKPLLVHFGPWQKTRNCANECARVRCRLTRVCGRSSIMHICQITHTAASISTRTRTRADRRAAAAAAAGEGWGCRPPGCSGHSAGHTHYTLLGLQPPTTTSPQQQSGCCILISLTHQPTNPGPCCIPFAAVAGQTTCEMGGGHVAQAQIKKHPCAAQSPVPQGRSTCDDAAAATYLGSSHFWQQQRQ